MSIRVAARPGEPSERFLMRFKRICSKSGLFREIKKRRSYEKPSDKRRREKKERIRAIAKAKRREERYKQRKKKSR